MASWFVFLMKTLTFHQWFFIHNLYWTHGWKKDMFRKKKFIFHKTKCFFFKFWTLYVSKINPFLDLKRNTTIRQKLRTTWYDAKLHGSTSLVIFMFVQLWNSFPQELKKTFREEKKKWYEIIIITVTESREIIYLVGFCSRCLQ